jgi:hypothetical protein
MTFWTNGDWKQAHYIWVKQSTLISDKIDFKTKSIRKDQEGYNILIREIIQQEMQWL